MDTKSNQSGMFHCKESLQLKRLLLRPTVGLLFDNLLWSDDLNGPDNKSYQRILLNDTLGCQGNDLYIDLSLLHTAHAWESAWRGLAGWSCAWPSTKIGALFEAFHPKWNQYSGQNARRATLCFLGWLVAVGHCQHKNLTIRINRLLNCLCQVPSNAPYLCSQKTNCLHTKQPGHKPCKLDAIGARWFDCKQAAMAHQADAVFDVNLNQFPRCSQSLL